MRATRCDGGAVRLLGLSLLFLAACGEPEATTPAPTTGQGRLEELAARRLAAVRVAADDFRARPGDESAAGLARAYFPDLAGETLAEEAPRNEAARLGIELPSDAAEPVRLATRGMTFRIARLDMKGATRTVDGATFNGARRFLAPVGAVQARSGALEADRLDDYDVVESPSGVHRATYRIELPAGIRGVRDAGGYFEFFDGADGPPVLRLHVPEARDAAGAVRTGTVAFEGLAGEGQVRLAEGPTLLATVDVPLSGLAGPVVVDPGFSATGSLAQARVFHTATDLGNRKVLVAGGASSVGELSSVEIYDSATGAWSAGAPMAWARVGHTATFVKVRRAVYVVGGISAGAPAPFIEAFDAITGVWSSRTSLPFGRAWHTADYLPMQGKILVAGGTGPSPATSLLFDVFANSTSVTGSLAAPRQSHVSIERPDDRIVVIGSADGNATAEAYNPSTGTWGSAGTLSTARAWPTLTALSNSYYFVAGGLSPTGTALATTEMYPIYGGTTFAGPSFSVGRYGHTATLLPSGLVMLVGGLDSAGNPLASVETFDQLTYRWSQRPDLSQARANHTALLLLDGKLLVTGGNPGPLASSLEYVPAGTWAQAGYMGQTRSMHSTTLLADGTVLAAGGQGNWDLNTSAAERYSPATGTWTSTGSMPGPKYSHSATLLADGRVLTAGGYNTSGLATAELYNPTTGTWTATGAMPAVAFQHAAVRLADGRVLTAGGWGAGYVPTAAAAIYDPSTGTWTATGSLPAARLGFPALLLPNGKVLVAGGMESAATNSALLFDPATGVWSPTGSMAVARAGLTLTLLPDGKVLAAGGNVNVALGAVELYDPATGTWTRTGDMPHTHTSHQAVVLTGGKVLLAGGSGTGSSAYYSPVADVYDPATGTWSTTLGLIQPRGVHGLVALPSDCALLVGGIAEGYNYGPTGNIASSERYCLPTAQAASATTAEDTAVSVAVSGTVTTGAPISYRVTTAPLHGTVTVTNPTLTYTPAANYNGADQFAYVSNDGAMDSAPAIVTLTVTPMADPPVASPRTATVMEDGFAGITLAGSDPDGGAVTYHVTVLPQHGTLTAVTGNAVTYTPAANYNGADTFRYVARNAGGQDSAEAVVTITVQPVNDAPVVSSATVTTAEEVPVQITPVTQDIEGDPLVLSVVNGPAHGFVALSGGTFTYTPGFNYFGADEFVIRASDGRGGTSAPATIHVDVTPVADPPVAEDTFAWTLEDYEVPVDLYGADPDGSPVTYVVTGPPAFGTLTGSPPNLIYHPDANYWGFDSFTFAVSDGTSFSPEAMAWIEVMSDVDAPVAVAQSQVLAEDGAKAIALSGNDADGDPLTYLVTTTPSHGHLEGTPPNVTYVPDPDYAGLDSFEFAVSDWLFASAPATVTLTVTPVNDPPVAIPPSVPVILEDSSQPITLGGSDADSDPLTFRIATGPANGTISGTPPAVTYTPLANWSGTDSFTFVVNDGTADSGTASVSLIVSAVNDPPTITAPGSVSTNEDTPLAFTGPATIGVSDIDAGSGPIDVALSVASGTMQVAPTTGVSVVAGASGTATVTLEGSVARLGVALATLTYVPPPDHAGLATLTLTVADGGRTGSGGARTATATIPISVNARNDAPVVTVPAALTIAEDETLAFAGPARVSVSDVDAAASSVEHVSLAVTGGTVMLGSTAGLTIVAGATGTAAVTLAGTIANLDAALGTLGFVPTADFAGAATLTVTAADLGNTGAGGAMVAERTTAISVVAVNDPPVAVAQTRTVAEDGSLSVTLSGTDVDGDGLTYRVVAQPSHGTLTGTPPALIYAPAANYGGPDAFTFVANDGTVDSNAVSVSVTVTPVNDAPVATTQAVTTDEDTPVAIGLGGTDADGDPLTFSVTQPAHGALTGSPPSITFRPDANWHGTTTFTFTATDGTVTSAPATVTVSVNAVNDVPVATAQAHTLSEDGSVAVTLAGTDPDGDPLTYRVATQPAHGTFTGTPPALTYAPAANYHGPDTFTFVANDGTADSAPATVILAVTSVNDAPVAVAQAKTVAEDGSVAVTLAGTDVDGDALTYRVVEQPAHGTITGTPPALTYAAAANHHGPDVFTFVANDGAVDSAPGTVTVTITPVNDVPVATAQTMTTAEDSPLAVVLAGTDVDGDTLGYRVTVQPAHGSLSGSPPNLTYAPAANYHGPDSFTFVANDGTVDSSPATVSVTVTAVNDAPIASALEVSTEEDAAVTITLVGTDVDGDAVSFRVTTPPAHGTLGGTAATPSYAPDADFHGSDAFTYVANDGTVDSAPVTVAIVVGPVNDPPVLVAPTPSGVLAAREGELVAFTVASTDVDGDTLTLAATPLPAGAAFDAATGAFSWTPAWTAAGEHGLVLSATDGTLSVERPFAIVVTAIDEDADGLPDTWETGAGLDPATDDADGDGIADRDEVGADLAAPRDTNDDGTIDALDDDSDGDGVLDVDEAGDDDPATAPVDTDDDGTPDFRDDDSDGDGVTDAEDLCRTVVDPGQADLDGDDQGDACDRDDDGDGIDDEVEDALGLDPASADSDGDRITDTDELGDLASPRDTDDDGNLDALDDDADDDGLLDAVEAGDDDPATPPVDTDDDGSPDYRDDDADGDGVSDAEDVCRLVADPDQSDLDDDGFGDACDDDEDGDGVPDAVDGCPRVADPEQADLDDDGANDPCDGDDDGDGVADDVDVCPVIADADQADLDDDGLGDACDDDRDGDGIANEDDVCPLVANADQADADGDGAGDACDGDRDGDGVPDEVDLCPEVADPDQADADGDGTGDVCDDTPRPPDVGISTGDGGGCGCRTAGKADVAGLAALALVMLALRARRR